MLNFKIKEQKHWSSIKTMLIYLDLIKEDWMTDIPIDETLVKRLRVL